MSDDPMLPLKRPGRKNKTGGRKKGSMSAEKRIVQQYLRQGLQHGDKMFRHPVITLLEIQDNEAVDDGLRIQAAKAVLPHIEAVKPTKHEIVGEDGRSFFNPTLSKAQMLLRIAEIAKMVAQYNESQMKVIEHDPGSESSD